MFGGVGIVHGNKEGEEQRSYEGEAWIRWKGDRT